MTTAVARTSALLALLIAAAGCSPTPGPGLRSLDVAALVAMTRAAPFGKAPDSFASPDGQVYLWWELHADPTEGCSPRHARPYVLKAVPEIGPG